MLTCCKDDASSYCAPRKSNCTVIHFRRFGPAGGGHFEPEKRSVARPAPTEKSQFGSIICQIDTAIRELERYVAEQRKITRRREGPGVGLVSSGRPRRSEKSDLR